MNKLIRLNYGLFSGRPFQIAATRQQTTSSSKNKFEEEEEATEGVSKNKETLESFDSTASLPDAEEVEEKKQRFREHVERTRNVGRFSKERARNKFYKILSTQLSEKQLNNENFFRYVYASHGKSSGIEPGVAWPHKSELENRIKLEKEYDLDLAQKIDILIKRKKDEADEYFKRSEPRANKTGPFFAYTQYLNFLTF
jgi:hypothetical protein